MIADLARKIILRKKTYDSGATGTLKRQNNKTPGRNEKTIAYKPPEWFLNDDPVDKSAVWSKIPCLIVLLFCHFAVLRSRQKSQSNFKRVQRQSRRLPWQLGRPC